MSLSSHEQKTTSNELNSNFELAGLTPDQICADLKLTRAQLDETMGVVHGKPEDVWALRDYLEAAVTGRGLQPQPYSFLTEAMRSSAERWFPLRPPVRPGSGR